MVRKNHGEPVGEMEGEMKKNAYRIIGVAICLTMLAVPGLTNQAKAEVHVNINLGPPAIVVAAPPAVVLVPHSEVYFVPEPNIDIFFYAGYWYSPRGDRWYRSREYNGPWGVVERRHVPPPVYRIPSDYRVAYHKERHIPYGQWKKQYRDHERGSYGEGNGHGRGHGHGKDR
jgi:hypothetical protein